MLKSHFNKAAGLQAFHFITNTKRLQHRSFSVNIAKLLRTWNILFEEHLRKAASE